MSDQNGQAAPAFLDGRRTAPDGVSIVIPNWNHEALLGRSVLSALRALADLRAHGVSGEVLVVDDGSRDGSPILLRQLEALYYEDGLRVYLLPRNTGLPAVTRMAGLQAASYRYACLLDADDELIPGNLWHFYRSIVQTGAALVYGDFVFQGAKSVKEEGMFSTESFQSRIYNENYIGVLVLLDRLQVLDAGGLSDDQRVKGREDWEMLLHLAANGRRLIFVPIAIGYYYPYLTNSLSKSVSQESEIQRTHMSYLRRVYNQLGLRRRQPMNTLHLRYHPDIGYL